jgi:hypothetical protein
VAAVPSVALADTLSVAQYRARLQQARDALLIARSSSGDARAGAVASAQRVLRLTEAVTVGGERIAVDDRALADDLAPTTESIDAGIARIGALLAVTPPAGAPTVDGARADERLHELVRQSAQPSTDWLDAIAQLVLRFLSGLRGPRIDPSALVPAVGLLGLALILFIVATLGRAIPERVRREVFVPLTAASDRPDPSRLLGAADEALAGGRAREAIHALFLYVIGALAAREVLRYDPALTDQELLARAAAIPHADALGDLVALYERSWFGLREPSHEEALRARELALRVAP